MRHSVPSTPAGPVAVVSCHVERPLDDDAWRRDVRRRVAAGIAALG